MKELPVHVGEPVKVDGFERGVWRVLSITGGLAELTKLTSFQPVFLRGIPVERLHRAKGILG